jgi:hypothetical protein
MQRRHSTNSYLKRERLVVFKFYQENRLLVVHRHELALCVPELKVLKVPRKGQKSIIQLTTSHC